MIFLLITTLLTMAGMLYFVNIMAIEFAESEA